MLLQDGTAWFWCGVDKAVENSGKLWITRRNDLCIFLISFILSVGCEKRAISDILWICLGGAVYTRFGQRLHWKRANRFCIYVKIHWYHMVGCRVFLRKEHIHLYFPMRALLDCLLACGKLCGWIEQKWDLRWKFSKGCTRLYIFRTRFDEIYANPVWKSTFFTLLWISLWITFEKVNKFIVLRVWITSGS